MPFGTDSDVNRKSPARPLRPCRKTRRVIRRAIVTPATGGRAWRRGAFAAERRVGLRIESKPAMGESAIFSLLGALALAAQSRIWRRAGELVCLWTLSLHGTAASSAANTGRYFLHAQGPVLAGQCRLSNAARDRRAGKGVSESVFAWISAAAARLAGVPRGAALAGETCRCWADAGPVDVGDDFTRGCYDIAPEQVRRHAAQCRSLRCIAPPGFAWLEPDHAGRPSLGSGKLVATSRRQTWCAANCWLHPRRQHRAILLTAGLALDGRRWRV